MLEILETILLETLHELYRPRHIEFSRIGLKLFFFLGNV